MPTIDFSAVAIQTGYTPAGMSVSGTPLQVIPNTANNANALAPNGGNASAILTGLSWGTTIVSSVKVQGVGGNPASDDEIELWVTVESGLNAGKGYVAVLFGSGFQQLMRRDAADGSADVEIGTSRTSIVFAENDIWALSVNESTGAIAILQNGTPVLSATPDTTYATGLTAGFKFIVSNHGGTGVNQFIYSGNIATGALPPVSRFKPFRTMITQ